MILTEIPSGREKYHRNRISKMIKLSASQVWTVLMKQVNNLSCAVMVAAFMEVQRMKECAPFVTKVPCKRKIIVEGYPLLFHQLPANATKC